MDSLLPEPQPQLLGHAQPRALGRQRSWRQDQVCRGKDGCKETGGKVRCDDTLAALGDTCGQDGDQACSVERDALLVCKDNAMVLDKKCRTECAVVTGKVRAGREGPSFECK